MSVAKIVLRFVIIVLMVGALYLFLQMPTFLETFRLKKSINVLVLPNLIDSEYLHDFEKQSGIKVNLTYFENYEELIVKLKTGIANYDLVMVADYAARILIQEKLVKKIEQDKIRFSDDFYPALRNLYYDPKNEYTLPFSWELFGIGIDRTYFHGKHPEATWGLLFNEEISPKRVGMNDDAREIASVAGLYLFGRKKKSKIISSKELDRIKSLLLKQKKRVVMYTDLRTDYVLVSKMAPVTLGFSPDIFYAMKRHPSIDFLLPQEGAFMIIDLFLLPVGTKKETLVYDFLHYLYQPAVLQKYLDRFNFFPVINGLVPSNKRFWMLPTPSLLSQFHFFSYVFEEQGLREFWVALKA